MKSINKDPYIQENGCLINTLGIRDKAELTNEEIKRFRISLRKILAVADCHSFADVSSKEFYYKLHLDLFGGVYGWAGHPRVIDMVKREPLLGGASVKYSHFENIESDLDMVFERIKHIRPASEDGRKRYEVLDYVANLWWVHPFREGNTRQHVVYMSLLAKSLGLSFDWKTYHEVCSKTHIRDYFVLYTLDGEPRERYFSRLNSFLS
ncbi:MAG: Fic family protein [Bacilli bacterium]|nr:Fic family protein [Bacilli bacterium]